MYYAALYILCMRINSSYQYKSVSDQTRLNHTSWKNFLIFYNQ